MSVRWEVLKIFFNIWLFGALKMHHLGVLFENVSGAAAPPRCSGLHPSSLGLEGEKPELSPS